MNTKKSHERRALRATRRRFKFETLERRNLLATVATNFESINSNDFTIGVGDETARFASDVDGDAFSGRIGVGHLYRSGSRAWMVRENASGFIQFSSPADSVSFWVRMRNNTSTGSLVMTALDSDGLTIGTDTISNAAAPFAQFSYTGMIDRITFVNTADQMISLDDFTSSVIAPIANAKPTFTAMDPPAALEDSGTQVVNSFASFDPGRASESSQSVLGYTVSNVTNSNLFSVAPTIDNAGNLTYTPAANAFGISTFEGTVQDDGGTVGGGIDTSDPQTFTIDVTNVNDVPSFLLTPEVTVIEDAGDQSIANFASQFNAGTGEGLSTASQVIHDEGANGFTNPLSTNNDNPTDLGTLAPGSNIVRGYIEAALSVGNVDVFTFTVEEGFQLDGVFVLDYQYIVPPASSNERNAFLAIDTGSTFPFNSQELSDVNLDESQFIGGTVFGLDDLPDVGGGDILPRAAVIAGSGFTAPLSAGTYTFYVQQTGPANTYSLDFQVSVAGKQEAAEYVVSQLSDPSLFASPPQIGTDGTLTFTPAANLAGIATFEVAVQDDGGTANGGVDTSATMTASITIRGVNDAPSFIAANPPSVLEDSGTQTLSGFIASSSIGPVDEIGQSLLGYTITEFDSEFFDTAPSIDTSGTLTYGVTANVSGEGTFAVTLQDDGGTLGGGVDTSEPQTFTITVSEVNDAPTLTLGDPVVVDEDAGPQSIPGFVASFNPGPMEDGQSTDSRVLHDEREGGGSNPFSRDNTQPTDVGPLSHGSNLVLGIVQSALSIGDVDVLTFTVDPGFQLDGLFVLEYEYAVPPNANERNAFLAIDDTDSFPFDAQGLSSNDLDESLFIGGTVFGLDDLPDVGGGNILPRAGNVVGSGFTGPLPTGTYTVYVQQTGPANSYTLDFRVSEVTAQTVAEYSVANISDPSLFDTLPAIDLGGNLTFTPADDVSGVVTFDVFVRDTGGVADGGQDISAATVATISIDPVNDAPTFSAFDPPSVIANSGMQTIADLVTNFDPGPPDESAQTLIAYNLTNVSNAGLFEIAPAIDSSGSLTYTPATDATGTSTFDLTVQDSGGSDNGGSDTSATATFTITVMEELNLQWDDPIDIIVGTLLSSTQLNATANLPGTLVYTPDFGTELSLGDAQTLSVTFTADDPIYQPVTQTVSINVVDPPIQEDLGDAPSGYPVLRADDGARHVIGSLFLGAGVDAEVDGQPSTGADADGSDDDGVTFLADMVVVSGSGSTASVSVVASEAGRLDAWIDFNGDGDWQDDGEQIVDDLLLGTGSNVISIDVPSAASPGNTAARFRLSSAGGLAPTGAAADGEVEDYVVTILDGDDSPPVSVALVDAASTIVVENEQLVVRSTTDDLFQASEESTGVTEVTTTATDSVVVLDLTGGIPTNGLSLVGGSGENMLQVLGGGPELDLTEMGIVAARNFAVIDLSDPAIDAVKINVNVVRALAPSTNSITIIAAENDGISFQDADDWRMGDPSIVDGRFMVAVNHKDGDRVESGVAQAWQNIVKISDVNNNGEVTAGDALRIINELGRRDFSDSETQDLVDPISVADWPGDYFDQNGDGRATALDALRVINELARVTPAGESEAENFDRAIDRLMNEIGDFALPHAIPFPIGQLPKGSCKVASFAVEDEQTNVIEVANVDSFFESQSDEEPLRLMGY